MIRHTPHTIAAPDGLDPEERWQDRGACRDEQYRDHADIWYAHSRDRDDVNTARRICAACTVRTECLEYALERREQWGMWGGLTEGQRRSILRDRRKTATEQAVA